MAVKPKISKGKTSKAKASKSVASNSKSGKSMAPNLAPSTSTAFNTLSLELNEQIAMFLDTDREVCDFRLICKATDFAVQTYRCGVWRDRYARRYDMPENNQGGKVIMMMYKVRSRILRKSAKFCMGQDLREINCMKVLRDLIVESYGNLAVGFKAIQPSNNIAVVEHFALHSGLLKKIFYCMSEKSNINRHLQILQLMLTHLELRIPSPKTSPAIGFAYSQFAVYSHPNDFPLFTQGYGGWEISTNLLLHIANFFKHHLTQIGESTLYNLFSELETHEKPKAWKSRIAKGGVQNLRKHWKGTYAYLHDLDEVDLIRQCEIGKEYYFTDSIDHHDGFQTLELDFEPQSNRTRWPKIFESHLNAMPLRRLCRLLDIINGPEQDHFSQASAPGGGLFDEEPLPPEPTAPQRGIHYQQFSGSGADAEPFHCNGILHALPPQEQIPGWQRISMMKYFDPLAGFGNDHLSNTYQVDDDAEINVGCWAYEGVVLPGGMIMLGRWWSPMDDAGEKRCMGPFIFWNVDKD